MSAETLNFSQNEAKINFQNWADQKNIKHFLLDLDDTICNTTEVFHDHFSQTADFLAQNNPLITRDQWHREVLNANNILFENYGVNPNKWVYAIDSMVRQYEITPEVQSGVIKILKQIYDTPLQMLYGSETGLDFLTKVNISLNIVTHANADWTWRKYDWLDLGRFVSRDHVFIIDENGHKTPESWRQAIDHFGMKPEECVVVGDSPRSDIGPAQKIGVKQCFLVDRSYKWSVQQQAVDDSTIRIKNLAELIEIGAKKL